MTAITPGAFDALTRRTIADTPEVPWYTVATELWAVLASEGAYIVREGAQ